MQTMLRELQALRVKTEGNDSTKEVNPWGTDESSQASAAMETNQTATTFDRNQTQLKLSLPKFSGDNPLGWVYKAEQFFDFKNISNKDKVQLASFHLEGLALQWHRWLTKLRGPISWDDQFTKAVLQSGLLAMFRTHRI
ncbi:hypothetical protein ACOSQ2_023200 [Xanthoceras sorbifolium]